MNNSMEIAALEHSISILQERIATLRNGAPQAVKPPRVVSPRAGRPEPTGHRTMSAAARARIAAAQRKRWAAATKQKALAASSPEPAPADEPGPAKRGRKK